MRLWKGGRDLGGVWKAIAISKKVLGDRRVDEKMDRSRGFHEMATRDGVDEVKFEIRIERRR
jgi:hypothetical protein